MEKVFLATIRDIWFNKSRSVVVIIALMMVVSFPIAFLNVAPNLEVIIDQEEQEFHLSHYNIFFNQFVDKNVADNVSIYLQQFLGIEEDDVAVEPRIFLGGKMRSSGIGDIIEGTWIDLDVSMYDPDNPPYVSKLELMKGRFPQSNTEIVILDSLALQDGIDIGSSISLYTRSGIIPFTIVGLIKSIEYSAYNLASVGIAYITPGGMERTVNITGIVNLANEISVYFEYDISQKDLIAASDNLKEQLAKDGLTISLFWFVRETSFRRALLDALNLTSQYMEIAAIFIFLVAGVVIFVVTNRYVSEQKTTIGAIYSFGVSRRKILLSFFARIFILSAVSLVLGLLLAGYLLNVIISELVKQWGLIGYSSSISSDSLIFTLISGAIVAYLFTFLAVIKLLQLTPYEAMRGRSKELKNRGLLFWLSNFLPTRILRNAGKNLTRNRTRSLLTIIAFTVALTFSGSLLYTDQSMDYTINQYYSETVSYDVEVSIGYDLMLDPTSTAAADILAMPDVANAEYYANSLVALTNQPQVLTYLMGLRYDTTMFEFGSDDLIEGRWFRANTSEIVISRYLQGTVGIQLGDRFQFDYLGLVMNGTVVGVVNEIQYSSSFLIDHNYVSETVKEILYPTFPSLIIANKLLLDLQDGTNPEEFQDDLNLNFRQMDIALTREGYRRRSEGLAESQAAIIYLMVILGLVVGVVSVFTTLLIAVIERERELALFQVMGYHKWELLFQVLFEGWIIGIIAIIPSLIFGQIVTAQLWVPIVSENIYQVSVHYPINTTFFVIGFAMVAITLSMMPAFRASVARKMATVIREE